MWYTRFLEDMPSWSKHRCLWIARHLVLIVRKLFVQCERTQMTCAIPSVLQCLYASCYHAVPCPVCVVYYIVYDRKLIILERRKSKDHNHIRLNCPRLCLDLWRCLLRGVSNFSTLRSGYPSVAQEARGLNNDDGAASDRQSSKSALTIKSELYIADSWSTDSTHISWFSPRSWRSGLATRHLSGFIYPDISACPHLLSPIIVPHRGGLVSTEQSPTLRYNPRVEWKRSVHESYVILIIIIIITSFQQIAITQARFGQPRSQIINSFKKMGRERWVISGERMGHFERWVISGFFRGEFVSVTVC